MAAVLADEEAGFNASGKRAGRPMISMRPDLSISEEMEDHTALAGAPRTSLVLVLLVLAAGLISFLGAYAVSGVLADADVIARWSPGADPRPRWMATGFVVLLGAFAAIAAVAKVASQSQLRRIDQMAD